MMQTDPARTIHVGVNEGDVRGGTGRSIQLAIDALAQRGGGTVRVLPGEYVLSDSLRLRSHITLLGDRDKTILRRQGPVIWSPLAVDADVGQREITPVEASRFRPGMGVCRWDAVCGWAEGALASSISHIHDGVLFIRDMLLTDRRAEDDARVINHYAMITAAFCEHVHVEGFTLDAHVDDPDGVLKTNRAAAVYLYASPHGILRGLTITGNCGDGLCVGKASTDALIEDCDTGHNGYYGIHPGSHSARCVLRRCHIHHNAADGLYICWGISHGEFTDNDIHHNGHGLLRSGICIGHKDTDNLIARNHVWENSKYGICFRRKTEANGAHRCVLRDNVIENNGTAPDELSAVKKRLEGWESIGCGIHVSGITRDLVLEDNIIRETRQGADRRQCIGIWLAQGVSGTRMNNNRIEGHVEEAVRDDAGEGAQVQAG